MADIGDPQVQLLAELKRMSLTLASVGKAIILARAREDCRLAQHFREQFAKTPGIDKIAERMEAIAAHRRALAEGWEQWLKQKGEM